MLLRMLIIAAILVCSPAVFAQSSNSQDIGKIKHSVYASDLAFDQMDVDGMVALYADELTTIRLDGSMTNENKDQQRRSLTELTMTTDKESKKSTVLKITLEGNGAMVLLREEISADMNVGNRMRHMTVNGVYKDFYVKNSKGIWVEEITRTLSETLHIT